MVSTSEKKYLVGKFVRTIKGEVAKVIKIRRYFSELELYLEFLKDSEGKKIGKDGWVSSNYISCICSFEEALMTTLRSWEYTKRMYEETGR